ncbi:hypothetical protein INR49_031371 [Caranx melampygus]|nr:hypothetical protein INR49_031371 [Caranx melampygus]
MVGGWLKGGARWGLGLGVEAGSEKRGIHRELEKKKSRRRKKNRDMKETLGAGGSGGGASAGVLQCAVVDSGSSEDDIISLLLPQEISSTQTEPGIFSAAEKLSSPNRNKHIRYYGLLWYLSLQQPPTPCSSSSSSSSSCVFNCSQVCPPPIRIAQLGAAGTSEATPNAYIQS